MPDSIELFKKSLRSFGDTQTQYRKKIGCLNEWKNQFQELEGEVTRLMYFFEQKYKESVLSDEFSEDVKAKLENRRDGIRLSVKSANRLLRRLNPDKPLETETDQFITDEVMKEKLNALEQQAKEIETEQEATENQIPVVNESEEATVKKVEVEGEENLPSAETEAVDSEEEVNTAPIYTEQNEEQDQSVLQQKDYHLKISLLQETIESNHHVLEQLDEHIQTAEKRFLTFIEKGVAPVLDGLYSGDKYGKELVEQLNAEVSIDIEKVDKWLEIYHILIDEIKRLFEQFSIVCFSPEIGDSFNEEKHEPIGVVEDPDFQDEQIKEVVRYGLAFEKSAFDIRPAQVIVVKNKQVVEQRGIEDEV